MDANDSSGFNPQTVTPMDDMDFQSMNGNKRKDSVASEDPEESKSELQPEARTGLVEEVNMVGDEVMGLMCPANSDSGNHSSEEELEEIITHKSYLAVTGGDKRKWSDLSQSDGSYESDDTEFGDNKVRQHSSPSESSGGLRQVG